MYSIVLRLREAKECEVYIVLTPEYEGRPNGKSLPVYYRMGQVRICLFVIPISLGLYYEPNSLLLTIHLHFVMRREYIVYNPIVHYRIRNVNCPFLHL